MCPGWCKSCSSVVPACGAESGVIAAGRRTPAARSRVPPRGRRPAGPARLAVGAKDRGNRSAIRGGRGQQLQLTFRGGKDVRIGTVLGIAPKSCRRLRGTFRERIREPRSGPGRQAPDPAFPLVCEVAAQRRIVQYRRAAMDACRGIAAGSIAQELDPVPPMAYGRVLRVPGADADGQSHPPCEAAFAVGTIVVIGQDSGGRRRAHRALIEGLRTIHFSCRRRPRQHQEEQGWQATQDSHQGSCTGPP